MKVEIKSFNGNLPPYLTLGKNYDVIEPEYNYFSEDLYYILDDYKGSCLIYLKDCGHLNGGKWEVVDE